MKCKVPYCEYQSSDKECIERRQYNACGKRKDYEVKGEITQQ